MTVPSLGEAAIRRQASAESFVRGEKYYRAGRVVSLVQRGGVLQAQVEGSQYAPYRVRITFDRGGVTGALCDCPYDWGGWCKHIVATLLACLREPDRVEERPTLDQLLAGLDREQLRDLLLHLAAHDATVVDEIESQIALRQAIPDEGEAGASSKQASRRHTPIDPQPIRRQVSGILHSLDRMRPSQAYWHVSSVVDQLRQLLHQVQAFTEAGDGRNALLLLETITDEYVAGWLGLDDSDGFASEFFGELGQAWAEAGLMAELSPEERERWAQKLTRWQDEIADYGPDGAFDPAQAAVLLGWDHPPLQRVLQGEITPRGAWEDEAPWYADELAMTRLRVLEWQGRYQEYLYLARAEGQMALYVSMLARLGRMQEAVNEGLRTLDEPSQFLALARELREREELAAALRVARHGLTFEGRRKGELAAWLCELADGMGEADLALEAATIAFREEPGMPAFQRVQELAGGRWPELREELLAHLRRASGYSSSGAQVDVFLHEGLIDDAIAAVEKGGSYSLLERVMDAAVEHRPRWVIEAARRQAERIIEAGQSKYYHHAVSWLTRARAAYQAAGREADWQVYLDEIRTRHRRKYKLMRMLEGFGQSRTLT